MKGECVVLKKKLFLIPLVCITLLSGCNSQTDSSKTVESNQESKTIETVKADKDGTKETYYARGLTLHIKEVSTAIKGDKKIVSIKINAKNESNEEKGFGSNDFCLKNGKETILPYADGVNFGEAIKKGESYEGIMSFEVSKKLTSSKLIYQPYGNSEAEWNIKF